MPIVCYASRNKFIHYPIVGVTVRSIMRFHHPIFEPLHFDYGTTTWSVNHMPLFGAILSVLDHRGLSTIHNITFFSLMKVLTKGRVTMKQAQAMFNLLDLTLTGDLGYSELAFLIGIIVAHKDHMEREFLYMNAWKFWVTFNEHGQDHITTREFRRTGLFFDFNYPTMYQMYRDYNWDDEKTMEFERFRFYLMSCIHFREVNRYQAKYIRYRQFKQAVLLLLQKMLRKVLIDNIFPSPMSILRAIKTIKIPPLEGTERTKHWTDLFECNFVRSFIKYNWEEWKNWWISKIKHYPRIKCLCKFILCGFWCCTHYDSDAGCCGDFDHFCAKNCCFVCAYGKRIKDARRRKKVLANTKRWGEREWEITDEEAIGLYANELVLEQNGEEQGDAVVPSTMKEIRSKKKKRAKVREMLTRPDVVAEVEWRPLGRPRCSIQ